MSLAGLTKSGRGRGVGGWVIVDDRMSCQADGPQWAHVGPSLWAKVWR